ncbi:MAG: hypothetical protein ACI9NC_003367, partial [Verrucomicrobiales bacterium]
HEVRARWASILESKLRLTDCWISILSAWTRKNGINSVVERP